MTAPGKSLDLFPPPPRTTPKTGRPPATPPNVPAATKISGEHDLWLCIDLPCLPLEIFADHDRDAAPFAIVDGDGARTHVLVCNPPAARLGVQPGLGLNAAFALAPELQTRARDTRREARALRHLACWAGQFTSRVSLEPPRALLLEIRGSLKLFGGLEALQADIRQGLAMLRYQARQAVAPTPQGALWLAVAGGATVTRMSDLHGKLRPLGLQALGWPEKVLNSLHGMGVSDVGACVRLPRDGFARRIGRRWLAELDRAYGRLADPRKPFTPPARFGSRIELLFELENTRYLTPVLQRLLEELHGFLLSRQSGVQTLNFSLEHSDEPATRMRVGLLSPSRDVGHMQALLEERLAQLVLPAPVIAAALECSAVQNLPPVEQGLFDTRRKDQPEWPQLVERLRARLGVPAVYGVCLVPEHRPEQAWRPVEPGTPAGTYTCNARPLWMLSEPQRLTTRSGAPCWQGRLQRLRGPERIETGWWDGQDVARDYYVAVNKNGLRVWIYRQRRAPRGWFLHGIFG